LRAYPKTSGASGLHVYLPLLEDRFGYAEIRTFAEAIASIVVARLPDLATIERTVSRRPRAVYVDFLQNVKGKTVASVYSPRARPGAPVSTPLRWRELKRAIDPGRYTIQTIFRRLGRMGDLWSPVEEDRQDIGPFLAALGR
jgi:bifunctional non-homologous end joining protein LigD